MKIDNLDHGVTREDMVVASDTLREPKRQQKAVKFVEANVLISSATQNPEASAVELGQASYTRSLGRYCTASATCAAPMVSAPARSAIVRESFSTR